MRRRDGLGDREREREREREKEKGKGGEVEVQWRGGVMWESGGEEEGWRNDR